MAGFEVSTEEGDRETVSPSCVIRQSVGVSGVTTSSPHPQQQLCVAHFVQWYNHVHQHSAIRFVTPEDRHAGRDVAIFAERHVLYTAARTRTPERWSGATRDWTPITTVRLNPEHDRITASHEIAA